MSATQSLADRARQAWAQKQARDAEWSLWANVPDLPHLRELVAWFCEGRLSFTPGHDGPRDPETEDIGAALAHANRSGFLTTNSQNGGKNEHGAQWRSAVEGLADDVTVALLRALVAGTKLCLHVAPLKFFRQDGTVPGVHQQPDGSAWKGNPVLSWRDIAFQFSGIPDGVLSQVTRLNYVQIVDPKWGPSTLLWDRLSTPVWNNPLPSTTPPARTAPTTSGAAMSSDVSYGSLKARVLGIADVDQVQGALQQAGQALDEKIAQALAAKEESSQLDETLAALMQAKEHVDQAGQFLGQASEGANTAAAGLS